MSSNFALMLAQVFKGPGDYFACVVVLLIAIVCVGSIAYLAHHNRAKDARYRLRWFFGAQIERVRAHDKTFPGYDLPSVVLALESLEKEWCESVEHVGAMPKSILALLRVPTTIDQNNNAQIYPVPSERMMIAPGKETSLPVSMLTFWTIKESHAENGDDRLAVGFMRVTKGGMPGGLDGVSADNSQVVVGIACASEAIANRFFKALEDRRRELCVYRGQAVDPMPVPGGIAGINFRPLRHADRETLVLTSEVENELNQSIVRFYQHADRLQRAGVEMKRCLLLHGPPGTGKTSISLYLAGLLPKFTICFVSGQRLLFPRELCRMARYLQPTLMVFEDIDLIAEHRDANSLATVLGELMNQIDGCEPDEQVVFVMNTNSIGRLEDAIRNRPGRVDQIIELGLPDGPTRERLIRHFARQMTLDVPDMTRVLTATASTTPASLKEIVKRAAVYALDRVHPNGAAGEPSIQINEGDLLLATEHVRAFRNDKESRGPVGFHASRERES